MARVINLADDVRLVLAPGGTFDQSMAQWIDAVEAREVVLTVQVIEMTGLTGTERVQFILRSAPIRDDRYVKAVRSVSFQAGDAPGVQHSTYVLTSAVNPLTRYVGWQLTTTATSSVTVVFRMWLTIKD